MDSLGKTQFTPYTPSFPAALSSSGEATGEVPAVSADTVQIAEKDLNFIQKSCIGWDLLGTRLAFSKPVEVHHEVTTSIKETIKRPFKKAVEFFKHWCSEEKIQEDFQALLDTCRCLMHKIPSKTYVNPPGKELPSPLNAKTLGKDEDFLEHHPVLHTLYLVYKGLRKIPGFLMMIPERFTDLALTTAYAESGDKKPVGSELLQKFSWFKKLGKNPWVKSIVNNYKSLMQVPGVGVAMLCLGPAFGLNRIAKGLYEYREGIEQNNPNQLLDGKVHVMTGALATVRPLALLAVLTEGIHIFLEHRVKTGKMDAAKADKLLTNAFATVTAPVGLALYHCLKGKENQVQNLNESRNQSPDTSQG